jgi:lysophospholipase L1-like esterase
MTERPLSGSRRRWLAAVSGGLLAGSAGNGNAAPPEREPLTLFTFGDSVLDCGHYNERGLTPGQLLVRNDDTLFPEFERRDLQSRGPVRLEHRAVDGATVAGLPAQAQGLAKPRGRAVALLTVGGNDLLRGLAADTGAGVAAFEAALDRFLQALPIRPVLMGTVYDPTFGDDRRNFLGVPAAVARASHRRVNQAIARLARRYGTLADLHAHFLTGAPDWYVHTIEPSLRGASEVRRVFWEAGQAWW